MASQKYSPVFIDYSEGGSEEKVGHKTGKRFPDSTNWLTVWNKDSCRGKKQMGSNMPGNVCLGTKPHWEVKIKSRGVK